MQHMRNIWFCFNLIWIACWLAACAGPLAEPTPTLTPAPDAATLVADLMQSGSPGGPAVLVGYLYADGQRAVLAPSLRYRPNAPPHPLPEGAAHQVWLGAAPEPAIVSSLQEHGSVRYALVQAEGQLEGPGTFGPDGTYPYQMRPTAYMVVTPRAATLAEIASSAHAYEGQYVRVQGVLLASDDSLLLVDAVGDGGVPAPGSTPVKLIWSLRDRYVLERLTQSSSGEVRFGAVQIEGIWRDGTLRVLALALRK
jgi:hypothetical protein